VFIKGFGQGVAVHFLSFLTVLYILAVLLGELTCKGFL